jgi:putative PIN family toxin of toxin-antitoxin system
MSHRVVFDTNTVLSALLFANGRLAWLRGHWRERIWVPLLSRATAAELNSVLAYPKFQLEPEERVELLGDYLPYCEIVGATDQCPQVCRDSHDQTFLDLAHSGKAEVLVSGDKDLPALAGQTAFVIEKPSDYLARVRGT